MALAQTPAQILAQILDTVNVGAILPANVSSSRWTLKVGQISSDVLGEVIALYDSGGFTPNPKWLLDWPTVQVVIRATANGYAAAYSKAQEVKDALLGIDPVVSGTDRVDGITMLADIAFLGNDASSRPQFSINFRLIMERSTNALSHRESL